MNFKLLLLSILAVFAPIESAVITVAVLVATDFILGVKAAKKRNEPITSEKMRRTVSKLLIFEICLLLAFLTETYLLSNMLPIAKLAAGYIGLVEFQSIVENLNDINGSPVFTMLLGVLNKKQGQLDDKSEDPNKFRKPID